MAVKNKTIYICSQCGYESVKWYGKCPQCGEWNTMDEHTPIVTGKKGSASLNSRGSVPAVQRLSEISSDIESRILTGINEFDRVLGGGIVEGSLTLLSGDPGIGKSTILLQMCQTLKNKNVLYISGEESARQIKLRANRLGVDSEKLYISAQTDVATIVETIKSEKPELVIIDSIQTMTIDDVSSSAGSVTQVRE
ncbi:MAG: AAA family ATPase, partial [Eubacterium sp.]|nr:AAA family ATPase [Eubacterium sp.]